MSTNVGSVDFELLLNSNPFNKGLRDTTNTIKSSGIENSLKKIGKLAVAAFSVRAVTNFGKVCVQVATETSNAWIGLNSIITGQGKSFSQAKNFINEYISDGLVPLNNAVGAYKNLVLRGYNSDQIQKTMNALKNSATFARQSTYSLGDAVQTATEGLKNENSVVVDNAGVTKNVAKMWEDYAKSIGKTTNNLTQQEKIQAEVNGILEETKFQSNDAAIYANTFSGKLAQLSTAFTNMKVAIGNVIQPIAKIFIPTITQATNAITNLFNKIASLLTVFGLKADSVESITGEISDIASGAANASDAVSEIGDSAKKTAKDLKSLASFDTAQILKKDDTSSSSSSSGSGAGKIDTSGFNLTDNVKQQVSNIEEILNGVNLEPLKNSFNNLREAISYFGQACGKILDGFYNNYLKPLGNYVISDALPHFLNSTANAMKSIDFDKLKNSFDNLWKILEPFSENVGNGLLWFYDNVLLKLTTWTINDVLPAFLNLLAGVLKVLNQLIEAFEPAFQWLWDNFLKPIAEWTGGVIVDVLNLLADVLLRIGNWMSENQEVVTGMETAVLGFFGAWKTVELMSFIAQSGGVINALKNITLAITGATLAKIKDKAETIYLNLLYAKDFVKSVVAGTGALVKQAAQWVVNTAMKIANTAATVAHTVATGAATAATWLFNAALTVLTSPITLVVVAIAALVAIIVLLIKNWDKVKETAAKCWEGIKNTFSGVGEWFSNIFQTAYDGIKRVFSNIGNFFSGIWNSIADVFSNLGSNIGDAISDSVKSGINGLIYLIERTINRAISLINGGINLINQIPGVSIGKIGSLNLPRLAQGGYVKANTPQLAMIGDNRHQGEVVAPEDKLMALYKKANQEMGLGNNDKVIELLERIIQILVNLSFDFNLYIDSYELNKRLEKIKNKNRFATNGG